MKYYNDKAKKSNFNYLNMKYWYEISNTMIVMCYRLLFELSKIYRRINLEHNFKT